MPQATPAAPHAVGVNAKLSQEQRAALIRARRAQQLEKVEAQRQAVARQANPGGGTVENLADAKTAVARQAGTAVAHPKPAALPANVPPTNVPSEPVYAFPPTARPARAKKRHYGVFLLFLVMVVAPTALGAWYLWTRAVDQYESEVGFAIRTEEAGSPIDILGALGGVSSSSSKDMDILNEFIGSQQLVQKLDKRLNLRAIFSKPANDPLMALPESVSIEALVDFWKRMVIINYDGSTGLMDIHVFAFDPQDARTIAAAVLEESGRTINSLSSIARTDATRFTKEILDVSVGRLSTARAALTAFRVKNQLVDPTADISSQMGVVATLNQQLASALIELDLLTTGSATETDPRVVTAHRRIAVIEARISDEKLKFGANGALSGYAALVADYERLSVDQEFAERTYLASLSAYDAAVAEAQQKSRYLAAYVEPTLAETPTAPNRPLLLALVAALGFFSWSILVLLYYAVRDRR